MGGAIALKMLCDIATQIYPKVVKQPKKEAPPRPSQPPPVKGKKVEDETFKVCNK